MQWMWYLFSLDKLYNYVKWKYHKVFSGYNRKNVILIHIVKIYQWNLYRKILTKKGNVKNIGEKPYKCNLCKKFFEEI